MKRASFRAAIDWIAQNDNSGTDDNVEEIAGYISTMLVAELFDVDQSVLAAKIAARRKRWLKELTKAAA